MFQSLIDWLGEFMWRPPMIVVISLGCSWQISACAAVPSAGDAALKAFLQENLRGNPQIEDRTTRFVATPVSLDDTTPMELVYVSGQRWCGSGGCTAYLLKQEGSSFKVTQKFTLVRLPIRVLCSKSNGWRDVAMWVRGGGSSGHAVVLRFNGSRYPSNPSLAPAVTSAELAGCGQDLALSGAGESLYP